MTGNVVLPLEADVRSSVSYGVSGTGKTGLSLIVLNTQDNCYVDSSIYDVADQAILSPLTLSQA